MHATYLPPEAPRKARRWLTRAFAVAAAALVGLFLLYLWITTPVMSREEMQPHFDAAMKYLTSASPERLALGKRYIDVLAAMRDMAGDADAEALEAEEGASAREELIAAGRESLEKLRVLAAEGAGALAYKNYVEEESDPNLAASVRACVTVLQADITQGLAARDLARVRDDVHTAFAVAETFEHRAAVVPRLVAGAVRGRVCVLVVKSRASFDEDLLRDVSVIVTRAEERMPPPQEFVWGEIDLIRTVLASSAPENVPAFVNRVAVKGAGLLLQRELELMAVAAKPPHEAMAELEQWERRLVADDQSRLIKWPWVEQCLMFFPAQLNVYGQFIGELAKLRGTRIVLALERYKRAKGEYPEKLGLLVPEFLQALPRDPFSGEEFHYARRAELYLLYSVGRNLEDDGGLTGTLHTPEEAATPQVLATGRDLVIVGMPTEEE